MLPDHWHMLLWPRRDGELSDVMRLLTVTHSRRVQSAQDTIGQGPLYQGRYRSFPVQSDKHYLDVARFVESHAKRARRVKRAGDWRWSSLYARSKGTSQQKEMLAVGPVALPRQWLAMANRSQQAAELTAVRLCAKRGRPYGTDKWVVKAAARMGLESTMRPQGRPRKHPLD